jgi:hypothetical protein
MRRYNLGLHKMRQTTLKGERKMMKRLTNSKHGEIRAIRFPNYESETLNMIDRLAAYEDTNLTPAEITILQEENAELKEAVLIDAAQQAELISENGELKKAFLRENDEICELKHNLLATEKTNATLTKALELACDRMSIELSQVGDGKKISKEKSKYIDYFIQQAKEAKDGK